MGKAPKGTRKFVRKHLAGELAARRRHKQIRAQRRRAAPAAAHDGGHGAPAAVPAVAAVPRASKPAGSRKAVEDMTVEELMDGTLLDDDDDEEHGDGDGGEGESDGVADEEEELEDLDDGGDGIESGSDGDGGVEEDADELDDEAVALGSGSAAEEDNVVDITPLGLEEDDPEDKDVGAISSAVEAENHRLRSEIERHREELEALRAKDPEFFAYLQENDAELLDFEDEDKDGDEDEGGDGNEQGGTGDDGEEDARARHASNEEGEDGEEDGEGSGWAQVAGDKEVLTSAKVDAWCAAVVAPQRSAGAARSLLRAFRAACHYGDSEEDAGSPFNIASSHVFNKVMLFVLREMDGILQAMLGPMGDESTVTGSKKKRRDKSRRQGRGSAEAGRSSGVETSARWHRVEPLARSYLGNALHILGQMTDTVMIGFTLRRLTASVALLGPFPKLARKLLKLVLHFWASGEGALPVLSILFIRQLAVQLPEQYLDAALRGAYKTFAAHAKFVNASTLPSIEFMTTCLVELYGLDREMSYQHAFVHVRQLAMILRNGLTMKTKDAYKSVYNWQYLNCLSAWTQVLRAHGRPAPMKAGGQQGPAASLAPLVYPLSQIITGVAKLVPTARYFPLRLAAVRLLDGLAESSGHLVPVAPLLLDVLQAKELSRTLTGGAGKAMDLYLVLRVSKQVLRTRAYQEDCVATSLELLAAHLAQWAYSIAFPELALVPLISLRRFMKGTTVDRFRRQAKQLIDHIERNIEMVERKRSGDERDKGRSTLVIYATQLKEQAQRRRSSLSSSSVEVRREKRHTKDQLQATEAEELPDRQRKPAEGETVAIDMEDTEGQAAFSTEWLPQEAKQKTASNGRPVVSEDEDVVEALIISDDEEDEDEDEQDADGVKVGGKEPEDDTKGRRGGRKPAHAKGLSNGFTGRSPGSRGGRGTKRKRGAAGDRGPGRGGGGGSRGRGRGGARGRTDKRSRRD
eukprot:SM000004S15083  [mRNA]  locus=s4:1147792:1153464:- [translate_table: standard]